MSHTRSSYQLMTPPLVTWWHATKGDFRLGRYRHLMEELIADDLPPEKFAKLRYSMYAEGLVRNPTELSNVLLYFLKPSLDMTLTAVAAMGLAIASREPYAKLGATYKDGELHVNDEAPLEFAFMACATRLKCSHLYASTAKLAYPGYFHFEDDYLYGTEKLVTAIESQ